MLNHAENNIKQNMRLSLGPSYCIAVAIGNNIEARINAIAIVGLAEWLEFASLAAKMGGFDAV